MDPIDRAGDKRNVEVVLHWDGSVMRWCGGCWWWLVVGGWWCCLVSLVDDWLGCVLVIIK